MKEAFEKLKERLVEKSNEAEAEMYRLQDEIGLMPCVYDRTDIEDCKSQAFIDAKNIVSEVEAEYGNGWIPCSERLPSREEYQKSNGQFIVSDGNRTYATYFDIYDTLKFGEPTIGGFRIDRFVIAWMPLPYPYTPTTD